MRGERRFLLIPRCAFVRSVWTDDTCLIARIQVERFSQAEASIRTSFLSALLSSCKLTDQHICLDVGIKTFHRKATMTQPFSNMSYLHCTRITRGTFVIWIYPPHLGFMWLICRSVSVEYTGIIHWIMCRYDSTQHIFVHWEKQARYLFYFFHRSTKEVVCFCVLRLLLCYLGHMTDDTYTGQTATRTIILSKRTLGRRGVLKQSSRCHSGCATSYWWF